MVYTKYDTITFPDALMQVLSIIQSYVYNTCSLHVISTLRAVLTYKDGWNSFYNIAISKGIMDIIKQHHHHLLPGDTIPEERTNFKFLAKLIDLLSVVTCMFTNNHQIVSSAEDDREYDELVTSRDSNGFPPDRSSCEPVDMEALSQAQIIQHVDEYYTR